MTIHALICTHVYSQFIIFWGCDTRNAYGLRSVQAPFVRKWLFLCKWLMVHPCSSLQVFCVICAKFSLQAGDTSVMATSIRDQRSFKAPSLLFLHFGHCVGFIPFCGIIGFLSAFSSGRAAMGSFCCKTVRIPAVDTAVALGLCAPVRFRASRSCTFWFWGRDSILCNAVGSCSES